MLNLGFGIASSLEKIGMATLNTDDNIDEKKKQTQEQTRVEKRKLKSEERRLKRIEERNASKVQNDRFASYLIRVLSRLHEILHRSFLYINTLYKV